MELGIGSYTYPWAIMANDLRQGSIFNSECLMKEATRFGVSRVQVADNLPLHEMGKASHTNLRDRALANGIQIETGTKGLKKDHLLTYLNIAQFYRSPFLRVIIDDGDYQPSPAEVISVINSVLPAFRNADVVLAIENHDRFPAKVLEEIIRSTDVTQVGICLDTVNSLGCGEGIHEVCAVLAPYTVNLHVKDFSIRRVKTKMGFVVEGTATGDGQLNLPAILTELEKFGHCKSATLEVWSSAEESVQQTIEREKAWVEKSIRYLKEVIK